MPTHLPTRLSLLGSLALLAACGQVDPSTGELAPAPQFDAEDTEGDVVDLGQVTRWDDPDYLPEIDRDFTEDAVPRALPLGSTGAHTVAYSIMKGETADDRAGISLANVGDLNNDGYNDLVIGSVYGATSSGDGAAYMDRAPFTAGSVNLGSSKGRYYTPTGSAKSLMIVGGGGDTDGDNQDDFMIGANTETVGTMSRAGAAYLVTAYVRGKQDLTTPATGIYRFTGEKANDQAGTAVDVVGDMNGDGNADVVVTAPYNDTGAADAGAVYIQFGPVTADVALSAASVKLTGETASDQTGVRAVGVGDTDGDGSADLAIGSRQAGSGAGAVYIVTSVTAGTASLSTATAKLTGGAAGDNAGNQLNNAGDVNGDGYDDVLVGALNYDAVGAAFLVLGPMSGTSSLDNAETTIIGLSTQDQFGSGLAAGDMDGDGSSDIAVAANRDGVADNGSVYVFLSPASGVLYAFDADTRIVGTGSGDYFGSWMDFVPDTDVRGTDMLVVGASGRGSSGAQADKGAVYLFDL